MDVLVDDEASPDCILLRARLARRERVLLSVTGQVGDQNSGKARDDAVDVATFDRS